MTPLFLAAGGFLAVRVGFQIFIAFILTIEMIVVVMALRCRGIQNTISPASELSRTVHKPCIAYPGNSLIAEGQIAHGNKVNA